MTRMHYAACWPALALVAAMLAAGAAPAAGPAPAAELPVSREPGHQVRFDNGQVRVYELTLAAGQWGEFHEHAADNFFVFMSTTGQRFEYRDGRHGTRQVHAGEVAFASTAGGPYTHRVGGDGPAPFHVVDIEILVDGRLGTAPAAEPRADPAFSPVLENSRGRAYRLLLPPGATTGVFTRPAHTAIFAVSGGRISERPEGRAPRLWDSRPGDFRWTDAAERLAIENDSPAQVEFVEIELF